jgi:hypothetical protein
MEKPPMKRAVLALVLISTPALAQDVDTTTERSEIVYEDVTEHIFGEVDVFGVNTVPELVRLDERKPMKIRNFITLRTSFDSEMSASVSEVR